jgi:hypothetical protein
MTYIINVAYDRHMVEYLFDCYNLRFEKLQEEQEERERLAELMVRRKGTHQLGEKP